MTGQIGACHEEPGAIITITSIDIRNHKIIREATCSSVPALMMICGPNGVGKTTLLDAIGRRNGTITGAATVTVAPATRTWRKRVVQPRMLYKNATRSTDVFDLVAQLQVHGQSFGRSIYTPYRDLWSDDESKQLVKPLLAKLKARWRDYVARQVEEAEGHTPERDWPIRSLRLLRLPRNSSMNCATWTRWNR